MSNEVDVLLVVGRSGGVDVAVVDGDVAALVLHHHDGIVAVVGGGDLEVAQGDVACLVERHHAVDLRVLVVAVAAAGVLVVTDLYVALSALALDGEGVHGPHAFNIRNAHAFVVGACLHFQRYGAFHTQCAQVVDGLLQRGVGACSVGSHYVVAALSAGHGDGGGGGRVDVNGRTVDHNAGDGGGGGLVYGGIGLHVVGEPEVISTAVGNGVAVDELVVGRERGHGARLVDVVGVDGRGGVNGRTVDHCVGVVNGRTVDHNAGDGGWCQLALCLYCYLQHLHVGLSLQYFAHANVLGGDSGHNNIGLLVALGLDGEVRTSVAALAHVLDGELSAVDSCLGDDGVELGTAARDILDEFVVVDLATLVDIEVGSVVEGEALVS